MVYLLEIDAIGSSSCIDRAGQLPQWESMLNYEVTTLAKLPHAVVYIDGGYSDANSPSYAAKVLNGAGIGQAAGFFTNDTHQNWTSDELSYGEAVSKLTGGAHFIIDTVENGAGPQLKPGAGGSARCNTPGLALGPRPTTTTGFPGVDAFLWTHGPALSGGSCNGGPPSGQFWVARAIAEAEQANGKLGPGHPSLPY